MSLAVEVNDFMVTGEKVAEVEAGMGWGAHQLLNVSRSRSSTTAQATMQRVQRSTNVIR